ncbi:MAG: DUF2188 domain-containing protein [Candidatus Methanoplasma sp.]|jgi:nitrogen fixation protein FixH|nr:DUF2188 domain-containing protein [Candidatus Methanoplasma sp.]
MGFFDKFKKKEEAPKKETSPETGKKDAAWATSKDKPVEENKVKTEPKMAVEDKKAEKPVQSKKPNNKVWHITKREDDGKWQVKAEGAAKATKLFRTKAEAEEYVKTLKSNNEGSRVVKHKKTGEFQKK